METMNEWQREQAEKAALDKRLAHDVARELSVLTGKEWLARNARNAELTAEYGEDWEIAGPDARRFDVHVMDRRGAKKVIARGIVEPNGNHGAQAYTEGNPSIQVALDRGVKVIAKEIIRRVLPDYERVFLENRRRMAEANEYAGKLAANRERMAGAFGLTLNARERESEQFWACGHRVQVSGSSVTLELRGLPVGVAMRVAEIVKEHEKAQKAAYTDGR